MARDFNLDDNRDDLANKGDKDYHEDRGNQGTDHNDQMQDEDM